MRAWGSQQPAEKARSFLIQPRHKERTRRQMRRRESVPFEDDETARSW